MDELLGLVGLNKVRDRRLSTYSKGMLQRIGLAQAVVHDPRLVVLDEPTASVDLASSRNICDLILDLFLRQRIMIRGLVALAVLLVVGALKFPVERNLAALHRQGHFDRNISTASNLISIFAKKSGNSASSRH